MMGFVMIPRSVLVTQPSLSVENLAVACSQLFDHKVVEGVDKSVRKLSDAERFLSIIDAMRRPDAPVGLNPDLSQRSEWWREVHRRCNGQEVSPVGEATVETR